MEIKRIIQRLKSTWSELDYAQRRLFEIRTGIEATGGRRNTHGPATIEELEALFASEAAPGPH
jgi:BMFP domain-containing protein YqiC